MTFKVTITVPVEKSYLPNRGHSGPSGDSGQFGADIDLTSYQDGASVWMGQIEVYGATLIEAEAIRDFILRAMADV